MKLLSIFCVFFILLLGHPQLAFSSEHDLDKHVREACPAAADWKDKHDLDDKRDVVFRQVQVAPMKPSLREELLSMAKNDQDARDAWQKGGFSVTSKAFEDVRQTDADNLAKFNSITGRKAFPTADQVGVDGVASAWLILQHADADPHMQAEFLATLNSTKLPAGIDRKEFALLRDRVQINLKKPQIYGTQFRRINGQWIPYPVYRPEDLDKRRAALGLMPFSLYKCVVLATVNYQAP